MSMGSYNGEERRAQMPVEVRSIGNGAKIALIVSLLTLLMGMLVNVGATMYYYGRLAQSVEVVIEVQQEIKADLNTIEDRDDGLDRRTTRIETKLDAHMEDDPPQ